MKDAQDDWANISFHEGYKCYLLVINYYTRYLWFFLSKNKSPLILILTTFLQTYGNKEGT